MKHSVAVLVIAIILLVSGCFLDTGDSGYTVSGTVKTEDGTPLELISVSLNQRIAITNSSGYYKFTDVSYGSYYIEAYINPTNKYYLNDKYRFEPEGQELIVKEDTKIYFTAFPQ